MNEGLGCVLLNLMLMYATDKLIRHFLQHKQLISNLRASKLISSDAVVAAMKKVDRANYVRIKSAAYEDSPQ